ncbi:MAG: methionine--tRNA ligase subunit beta [archaeon YNP-LCB-003-016]|uniref:methionine--tRNA ligase subunit beta n=1 Tax=Candidatus Culexarchaeum yellowstonense TaxID=2928963 RepID=UPI0029D9587D|nr:methionine--tRNA ligase subunit beta [Candidatus Culexarchaeum yellowstonense]
MRVGLVKNAERIPRTRKLIKLSVDFGDESRIVVAGIGDQYQPEDLMGKKMIFVVNLKPKNIAGVESQAMLIVAEEADGKVHLITVEDEVPLGSKVW